MCVYGIAIGHTSIFITGAKLTSTYLQEKIKITEATDVIKQFVVTNCK